MSFQKYVRTFAAQSYDPAELVAATDEEATELAHLDTNLQKSIDIEPNFAMVTWPTSIKLRVRLFPIPFTREERTTQALFISNEVNYQKVPFYEHLNCYAALNLVYEGKGCATYEKDQQIFSGNHMGDLALKIGEANLIYCKPFPQQTALQLICQQRHLGAAKWAITTHQMKEEKINTIPIFSCGGYFQPHQALENYIPLYATLSSTNDLKTQVVIKSQQFWHEKKIFETQGGKLGENHYYFHDPISTEESLSLSAALAAGYARIRLIDEDDERIYKSFGYVYSSLAQETVDITFIPA